MSDAWRMRKVNIDVAIVVVNLCPMEDATHDWDTTRVKYDPAEAPPTPEPPDARTGWRLVGMTHVEGRYETAILFAWERAL